MREGLDRGGRDPSPFSYDHFAKVADEGTSGATSAMKWRLSSRNSRDRTLEESTLLDAPPGMKRGSGNFAAQLPKPTRDRMVGVVEVAVLAGVWYELNIQRFGHRDLRSSAMLFIQPSAQPLDVCTSHGDREQFLDDVGSYSLTDDVRVRRPG